MADKRGRLKMGSDNFYPAPFWPIGSIYISVNNTNPSTYFGGTWEQIKSDAYLKIVSSNAGSLGGTSSDHKIPVSSMPAHKHAIFSGWGDSSTGLDAYKFQTWAGADQGWRTDDTRATSTVGGGQAYYPYYLGVYVFKRTA